MSKVTFLEKSDNNWVSDSKHIEILINTSYYLDTIAIKTFVNGVLKSTFITESNYNGNCYMLNRYGIEIEFGN